MVLGNAFGIPGITVDTHFGRLVRRFGWTSRMNPVKVEEVVGKLIPRKEWTMLSHVVIFHGRRTCHAKRRPAAPAPSPGGVPPMASAKPIPTRLPSC